MIFLTIANRLLPKFYLLVPCKLRINIKVFLIGKGGLEEVICNLPKIIWILLTNNKNYGGEGYGG